MVEFNYPDTIEMKTVTDEIMLTDINVLTKFSISANLNDVDCSSTALVRKHNDEYVWGPEKKNAV